MGQLAEAWGYADATESLLVIDPTEAFIFQARKTPLNFGPLGHQ
jgi:hypothetical protein